jgi:2',3'-cyclic-nucleotide 2'-phosphodiesterase (5'-nucleotidase family)
LKGALKKHRAPASPITRFSNYSITRFTVLLLVLSVVVACGPRSQAQASSLILSIVGTNDLHGGVLSRQGRGGLAQLDGYVRNLRAARAKDGGAVVLLDAGDLFQGTLESNLNEGAVVIAAYNAMRYDAAAIGNHEFDFGPVGPAVSPETSADDPIGALKSRAREAKFPFLSANLIEKSTGRPPSWEHVKPSTILTLAGVRIGVVGLATLETMTSTLTLNTRALDVTPLAPALEAEAKRLREQGATIVIATAHAGGRCTQFDNAGDLSSCQASAEIFDVARALAPGLVDVIVAGHRHEGIAHDVAGIAIVSSFSGGRAFGRVDLTVDRASGRVTRHHIFPPHDICERDDGSGGCAASGTGTPAQYEGAPVQASREIEAIFAPAVDAASAFKDKPLNASLDEPFPKPAGDGESALGNLLADWMRASAGSADVAIANRGGVRAALPQGPLTYGRLFELTPFDNRQAQVTLTGAELSAVVRHDLERRSGELILSGVRARATCERGGLHVALQRDSGTPIADGEMIKVVTSDFLATGGGDMLTPVMPFKAGATIDGPNIREQIAQWLMRSGGSWRARDLTDPQRRRLMFDGVRPVRCGGGQ